jgi:hypothetical protein
MDQREGEPAASTPLPRNEEEAVSVVWSSWPGWIRTHLPDEDDLRWRRRAAAPPEPQPRPEEAGPERRP